MVGTNNDNESVAHDWQPQGPVQVPAMAHHKGPTQSQPWKVGILLHTSGKKIGMFQTFFFFVFFGSHWENPRPKEKDQFLLKNK